MCKGTFEAALHLVDPSHLTVPRPDLVCVGSRAQNMLKRLVLGSVSSTVLSQAAVPLCVVRSNLAGPQGSAGGRGGWGGRGGARGAGGRGGGGAGGRGDGTLTVSQTSTSSAPANEYGTGVFPMVMSSAPRGATGIL